MSAGEKPVDDPEDPVDTTIGSSTESAPKAQSPITHEDDNDGSESPTEPTNDNAGPADADHGARGESANEAESSSADESPDAGDAIGITANVDHSRVDNFKAVLNENNYNVWSAESTTEPLSRGHFRAMRRDELLRQRDSLLADVGFEQRCIETLRADRLLLIHGPAELGKSRLALLALAGVALDDTALAGVLVNHRLPRQVRGNLDAIVRNRELLNARALLFKNAFNDGQHQFEDTLLLGDDSGRRELSRRLADANAYLVLTSDAERVPEIWRDLPQTHVAPPPDESLRARLLDRRLDRLNQELDTTRFGTDDRTVVIDAFASLARLTRFCDRFLIDLVRGEMDVSTAIRRFERQDSWLLSELPAQHPDAWGLLLAIMLGGARNHSPAVPSLVAHDLGERLRQTLLPRRDDEPPTRDLHDERLLVPARLQRLEARDQPPHAHRSPTSPLIGFVNDDHVADLWRAIRGHGHRLAISLLPVLTAELDKPATRPLAAAGLGQLGELAPETILYPLLDGFAKQPANVAMDVLAPLFLGVFNTDNDEYRQAALHRLRQQTDHADGVLIYLLVLRAIGTEYLREALESLFAVLNDRLGAKLGQLRDIWERLTRLFKDAARLRELFGQKSASLSERRKRADTLLGLLIHQTDGTFDAYDRNVLDGAQFIVTGLCFGNDPVHVAKRTRQALTQQHKPTRTALGATLAILWCDADGVFDKMARFLVLYDADADQRHRRTDRTLIALIENPMETDEFATFLAQLDFHAKSLPPSLHSALRTRWLARLVTWVEQGSLSERGDAAVRLLLKALRRKVDNELWSAIAERLRLDPVFQHAGSPCQEIARDALLYIPEAVPLPKT